jgi:hypothetical protein
MDRLFTERPDRRPHRHLGRSGRQLPYVSESVPFPRLRTAPHCQLGNPAKDQVRASGAGRLGPASGPRWPRADWWCGLGLARLRSPSGAAMTRGSEVLVAGGTFVLTGPPLAPTRCFRSNRARSGTAILVTIRSKETRCRSPKESRAPSISKSPDLGYRRAGTTGGWSPPSEIGPSVSL